MCSLTSWSASARSIVPTASASGMFRMRPARTRLTFLRMNASSFARYSASSIWFSVTPGGRFARAILPSVSPRLTSWIVGSRGIPARSPGAGDDDGAAPGGAAGVWGSAADGAAPTGGGDGSGFISGAPGAGCGCDWGSACAGGVAEGVRSALAAACGGGCCAAAAALALYSGGSRRKVYSRTSLPLDHVNSTSNSRNGSLTGCELRRRRIGVAPRRSIVKRTSERIGLGSMPACANACAEASRAARSSSPACSETISTSALSGWPSAEIRVSLPSPAAWATDSSAPKSAAITTALVIVLSTLPLPPGLLVSRTK